MGTRFASSSASVYLYSVAQITWMTCPSLLRIYRSPNKNTQNVGVSRASLNQKHCLIVCMGEGGGVVGGGSKQPGLVSLSDQYTKKI